MRNEQQCWFSPAIDAVDVTFVEMMVQDVASWNDDSTRVRSWP